jgi:hypothetical protein
VSSAMDNNSVDETIIAINRLRNQESALQGVMLMALLAGLVIFKELYAIAWIAFILIMWIRVMIVVVRREHALLETRQTRLRTAGDDCSNCGVRIPHGSQKSGLTCDHCHARLHLRVISRRE